MNELITYLSEKTAFLVTIPPDDKFYYEKTRHLMTHHLNDLHFLEEDGHIPIPLHNALRIFCANEDDLYFLDPYQEVDFISPQNEMKSLILLKTILNEQLRNISNTQCDQDQNSLSKLKLERSLKCAQRLCYEFTLKCRRETQHPPMSLEQKKAGAFFDWIAQNGIQHKLGIAEFDTTGRGLICQERILCDEVVIRLPRHMVFSIESALQSKELGPLFAQLKHEGVLDDDTILMLFTIHEKHNPNSFWRPYFDILPASLPTAMFFNDREIALLTGFPLHTELQTLIARLRQSYQSLFPMLSESYPNSFPAHIYTWENFVWARAIFDSRGFSFEVFRNCLLPFIDSMNTDDYAHIEMRGKFNSEHNVFEVRALADIDPGRYVQRREVSHNFLMHEFLLLSCM
jgi:hypothetical protein